MAWLLLASDRRRQLFLGHAGAALDAHLARALQQLLLAAAQYVHATVRTSAALTVTAGRVRIRRTLVALRLPVVAHLLVRVLERRERRHVRAASLAVRLDGAVVGFHPRAPRLRGRALDGVRYLVLARHRNDSLPTKGEGPTGPEAGRAIASQRLSCWLPPVPAPATLSRAEKEAERPQDQGRDQHVPEHVHRESTATQEDEDQRKYDQCYEHLNNTSRCEHRLDLSSLLSSLYLIAIHSCCPASMGAAAAAQADPRIPAPTTLIG